MFSFFFFSTETDHQPGNYPYGDGDEHVSAYYVKPDINGQRVKKGKQRVRHAIADLRVHARTNRKKQDKDRRYESSAEICKQN